MRALIGRAVVVAAAVVAVAVPAVAASAAPAPAVSWSQGGTPVTSYDYGTVNAGSSAEQTFTLKNSGGSATAALKITVSGPAFSIASGGDRCTGTSLGPGKSCTVTVRYAPAGAGQNDTGTLTAASPKIKASLVLHGASNTVTVTSPGNQTSTVGTAVSLQISASDSGSGLTLTYSATGLPAGLSISSSGLISGTPTTAATSNVTVTVTDTDHGSGSATFTWTVNPVPATSLQVSAQQTSVTAGQTVTVTVTALDAFGHVATGYTGTVHFTSTDPQAQLPADSTLTNGVGTFQVILKTAGNQVIFATDTANSGIGGSAAVTVTPAAAATLQVSDLPASVTAGTQATFTVTALDAFGNTVTGYTGTVAITSTDPQAQPLPAESTLTNGVGTFNVTLYKAGNQTVIATDPSSGITGAAPVTVTPAAPYELEVFQVTSPISVGQPATFQMQAVDVYGNVATSYGGTVEILTSDTTATLPPDFTTVNGEAEFSVTFGTAGQQEVEALDTTQPLQNEKCFVQVGQ